ncbi:hypothetical protein FRC14_000565 [Serendipita sp. 396]|nr:hypothetical protein FRC14_000565 [Serendipita sp. 396]KAG8788946.1 hypothetical protein FRC15_000978 [Serendipita sp. 397]KAG8804134.1 hypothetical protein FRC16_000523 [Serendipita sp. 398]KAG8813286.1 hypothetical protein FRC19_002508 [Serendipita sp. 401]KAG8876879.1 hypothetical protein FRC20_000584 [Serendipita sp. 405]KAG9042212.1 hypothetical protein FS842_002268 [Serendipita sp. 407]
MADPQTDLRDSEEFPAGYGDIQLISSDRAIFHFQQWLLMYMSPVFKDMFTIGDAKGGNNPPSVTLSEDSKTISMVLRFIDPMKDNPTLDFTILPPLLEAARKYQFGKINDWVTSWLNGNDPAVEATATQFNALEAIELLEVGTTFNVPRLSQLALRVLIKAPAHDVFVPQLAKSEMFQYLMKLRAKRIDWFRKVLKKLLGRGAANQSIHAGKITMEDVTYIGICTGAIELMHAIGVEPSYACCMRNWSNHLDNIDYIHNIESTKKDFKELCDSIEAELPVLPRQ